MIQLVSYLMVITLLLESFSCYLFKSILTLELSSPLKLFLDKHSSSQIVIVPLVPL